ncbi:hypothetical protein FQZ97_1173280 [compost metagenome]
MPMPARTAITSAHSAMGPGWLATARQLSATAMLTGTEVSTSIGSATTLDA